MRIPTLLVASVLLFSTLGPTACIFGIAGSGHAIDDTRSVAAFDAVEVRAGLVADVAPGSASIVVHGDDNLVQHVLTTVRGRTLVVEPDASFDPQVPLVVTVRTPLLSNVTLRSGGRVTVHDVAQTDLALRCESGGELVATGVVDHLDAVQSAGGDIDAAGLLAASVTVDARAGGETRLHVRDAAFGSVASGSEVTIHGRPRTRAITETSEGVVRWIDDG
jgi:hypothetical protein